MERDRLRPVERSQAIELTVSRAVGEGLQPVAGLVGEEDARLRHAVGVEAHLAVSRERVEEVGPQALAVDHHLAARDLRGDGRQHPLGGVVAPPLPAHQGERHGDDDGERPHPPGYRQA